MNRRDFIQGMLAFGALSSMAASCHTRRGIKGGIVGSSAHVGHLLRDKKFDAPTEVLRKEVVIVGGGVSGLSAARHLYRQGVADFVLLDLEDQVGGNAAFGHNDVSSYPWGAHYIPIPNNSLTEYLQFLTETGVITGRDAQGLPVYNDYYLCFDPEERLYINGKWQEGLVPQYGVPQEDKGQIERFLALMDEYRHKKGSDGKDAFALPTDESSRDEAFVRLDRLTMKAWLQQQGFKSPYLHWYVNYCTRDDFGTSIENVSAWAGIHYFACRKGAAANAEHQDVLTWPEGNGWLVRQLQQGLGQIQTGALAVKVEPTGEGVDITYFEVPSGALKVVKAKQCILAIPQFVAARLLGDKQRIDAIHQHMHYVPWMVANLKVRGLEQRSGAPASWDNVIYESDSLGYVTATHQLVDRHIPKQNLTYYLPLTKGDPLSERKAAQAMDFTGWKERILTDLKRVHPNIETATEEMKVMVWGHAMVQPRPGLIHGAVRRELAASVEDKIHFAHTDLAGVSLFEEAFYQGLHAAQKVITQLSAS